MKKISVTFSLSGVSTSTIEVQDDFELKNADSCESWDWLCISNPELYDIDLLEDEDIDGMDLYLSVMYMEIEDEDGHVILERDFYD